MINKINSRRKKDNVLIGTLSGDTNVVRGRKYYLKDLQLDNHADKKSNSFVKAYSVGLKRLNKANTDNIRRIILVISMNEKVIFQVLKDSTNVNVSRIKDALLFLNRYGLVDIHRNASHKSKEYSLSKYCKQQIANNKKFFERRFK